MLTTHRFLLALAGVCLQSAAAVLPPEKLLPNDTLLVATAPDWAKARLFCSNSPYGRLWQDPAIKPFKDKFIDKFTSDVLKPAEQNLGIKFSDYQGLVQGQVTFALLPVTQKDKRESRFAGLLLIDSKNHASQLKTNLAQIIKKWTDAGKSMKKEKIRELDFTTLVASPDDLSLSKIFPKAKPAEPPDDTADKGPATNTEITLGQVDSLLLVSDSTEAIDKVLSRQTGGVAPPLEELPAFQSDYGARLRQSPMYVWLNVKALMDVLTKPPATGDDAPAHPSRVGPVLAATALANVASVSLSYQDFPDGQAVQLFIAVPEDKRPALLKILAADPKDSSPPGFVPADAARFFRWRLNIARSWKALDSLLNDLAQQIPFVQQVTASFNMVFQMAGKDKDEHYDLKSELLNSLGDDLISYDKAPGSGAATKLNSSRSLLLLGSSNPDKLASALKVLLSIPSQGAPVKDREFLGRKIYTIASPATAGAGSPGLSFSSSGGYVAISSDADILEEYLRSNENKPKALIDTPGLADVAQRAGGMATGLFGYGNNNLSMRPVFDLIRKPSVTLPELLGSPLPPGASATDPMDAIRKWADFSLLPHFDTVAKYFYYSVYSAGFSPDGFAMKFYAPTPPQLRH